MADNLTLPAGGLVGDTSDARLNLLASDDELADLGPTSATKTIALLVGPEEAGQRLDTVLAAQVEGLSRAACVRLIETGNVTINGTDATQKSERLALGDRLVVVAPVMTQASGPLRPNPDIELDIRYEDEWLLVISKQADLVCHPSAGHVDDTLANALVAHCGYEHLGLLQGDERPGIVHRLDRDTSGLMLAAKDNETQQALQDLIRLRVLDRRYVTLVHGYVAADEGTITTGIARSRRDRMRMTVSNDPLAREAITTFRVLERFDAGRFDDGYTLLECHLYTGRTHQIRVHMRHVQHACVGDPLYGRGDDRANLGLHRQFLHSWSMSFEHPKTGEQLSWKDALPQDLADVLASIADRSMDRTQAGDEICPQIMGQRG